MRQFGAVQLARGAPERPWWRFRPLVGLRPTPPAALHAQAPVELHWTPGVVRRLHAPVGSKCSCPVSTTFQHSSRRTKRRRSRPLGCLGSTARRGDVLSVIRSRGGKDLLSDLMRRMSSSRRTEGCIGLGARSFLMCGAHKPPGAAPASLELYEALGPQGVHQPNRGYRESWVISRTPAFVGKRAAARGEGGGITNRGGAAAPARRAQGWSGNSSMLTYQSFQAFR